MDRLIRSGPFPEPVNRPRQRGFQLPGTQERQGIAYTVLASLAFLLSRLPLSVLRFCGRVLGRISYLVARSRRVITEDNLRRAYPDKDDAWVKRTARLGFEHLLMVIVECIKTWGMSSDQIADTTRQHNLDALIEADSQGRGVLILSLHAGNWEWMGLAVPLFHRPISVVARPLDWPSVESIVAEWRVKTGNAALSRHNSIRKIISCLKNGELVAILLDQSTDWYEGVWVDFFGRPTCTVKLMARLAATTGTPVVPAYNYRAPDGKFDVYYGPIIQPINTGDTTRDVWEATQAYSSAMEEIIRRHPEQWMWMHRRWKIRPFSPWPRRENGHIPWEDDPSR